MSEKIGANQKAVDIRVMYAQAMIQKIIDEVKKNIRTAEKVAAYCIFDPTKIPLPSHPTLKDIQDLL